MLGAPLVQKEGGGKYRNRKKKSMVALFTPFGSKDLGKWRKNSFDPSFKGKTQEPLHPLGPPLQILMHEERDYVASFGS